MAFTEAKLFETVIGNKIVGCYKLTGDGSDTTWSAPVGTLDAVWLMAYTASGSATSHTMTFTGSVVTFDFTPSNGSSELVFYVGT